MKPIGLITCAEEPVLYDDDVLLFTDLKAAGVECKPVIWDDPLVDYSEYSFMLIRSAWDYHYRYTEFSKWLETLETMQTRVYNEIAVLRNNLHKAYLKDFSASGFNLIPSVFVDHSDVADIDSTFERFSCDELVIKPMIGASSYHLERIRKGEHFDLLHYALNNTCGFIVQKYMPEVALHGEVSLVYIDNAYSHAVTKKPRQGDFRVQDDYGGTFEYFQPDKHLRQHADAIIQHYNKDLLYARVDCLYFDGQFFLMELELIEPILYLHDPVFRRRFVNAVEKRLRGT